MQVKEVAKQLGVSKAHIYKLLGDGFILGRKNKDSKVILIQKESLTKFLKSYKGRFLRKKAKPILLERLKMVA